MSLWLAIFSRCLSYVFTKTRKRRIRNEGFLWLQGAGTIWGSSGVEIALFDSWKHKISNVPGANVSPGPPPELNTEFGSRFTVCIIALVVFHTKKINLFRHCRKYSCSVHKGKKIQREKMYLEWIRLEFLNTNISVHKLKKVKFYKFLIQWNAWTGTLGLPF